MNVGEYTLAYQVVWQLKWLILFLVLNVPFYINMDNRICINFLWWTLAFPVQGSFYLLMRFLCRRPHILVGTSLDNRLVPNLIGD